MAFSGFRYHPDAEAGLIELMDRGKDTFEELKRQIRLVQDTWEPEDEANPVFVLPFEDFFLAFTVAQEDKSVLVLAAVRPQPPA